MRRKGAGSNVECYLPEAAVGGRGETKKIRARNKKLRLDYCKDEGREPQPGCAESMEGTLRLEVREQSSKGIPQTVGHTEGGKRPISGQQSPNPAGRLEAWH